MKRIFRHAAAHARNLRAARTTAFPALFPRFLAPLLGAAGLLACAGSADATQKEFTSGTSLTSNGNYNPTGAPVSTDNIVFDSGSTGSTSLTITATSLNVEDFAFSTAATSTISNTTSGTTSSTLTLNGGRGSSVPLLDENSTKTLTFKNGSTGALNLVLAASGSFEVDNSGGLTISSNIGETGGARTLSITGAGSGVVTLSGTNSFTGGLVAAGTEVDVSSDANLGGSGGSVTINGGRLGIATNSFIVDSTRAVSLGANPTGGSTTGTLSIKGSITTTFNQGFQNLSGSVGDLVKQGGGTLQLGGASTYSGTTFLNNGTTQLTIGNNRLPTGTTVALGQTASANVGTLDLNGFNQQIAGLNSTNATTGAPVLKNTVTTSTTASTLTLGGSSTYAYGDGSTTNSGTITGALSVNKTGTGTQTLGDANTYTGSTSVSNGILVLDTKGSILGSNSVQITGTGALTLNNAAALADAGTLSLVSGTTLNLNSASGTSETIGVLMLDGTTEPAGTYTYSQLMAFDPGITFTSSLGETLTVTAVPEPATIFAGLLIVGGLAWSQRRRITGFATMLSKARAG